MEKVYVYKDSYGEYRVHPGVVVLGGNEKLRVFNATALRNHSQGAGGSVKARRSRRSRHSGGRPRRHHSAIAGKWKDKAYGYKVSTSTGKKAHGNSDPVLIIEN